MENKKPGNKPEKPSDKPKSGRFIIFYSKFEFEIKKTIDRKTNQFFFGKPNSFRFFPQISKIKFYTRNRSVFQVLPFSTGSAFNNRRAGSDSRRWHRTMLSDSFRSLRKKHGTFALPRHQPIHPHHYGTTPSSLPARPQPASLPPRDGRSLDRHRRCAALPGYALARSRICRPIIRQTRLIPHPARSCTFCPREKKKLKRECTVHTYAASKAA
jgi:hypothetical protein